MRCSWFNHPSDKKLFLACEGRRMHRRGGDLQEGKMKRAQKADEEFLKKNDPTRQILIIASQGKPYFMRGQLPAFKFHKVSPSCSYLRSFKIMI